MSRSSSTAGDVSDSGTATRVQYFVELILYTDKHADIEVTQQVQLEGPEGCTFDDLKQRAAEHVDRPADSITSIRLVQESKDEDATVDSFTDASITLNAR